MKIAVINGSPKGGSDITLQTVRYLEIRYPEHEFAVLHAGLKIKDLEKDFSQAKELLESSDAVLFAYPVYTFSPPSQLHCFIRLMKQNNVDVKDKYATHISTSKHLYNIAADKYVEKNSLDLGMRYIRGLSADMKDSLEEKEKNDADKFFEHFLRSVKEEVYTSPKKEKISYTPFRAKSIAEKKKQTDKKKDSFPKENKYEIYGQRLEMLGLSRPIYKDDKITITYMGDRYYYIFENHIGLGVPILAYKMMEIIENPDKLFTSYWSLSDKAKNLLTLHIQNPNLEEMFTKVKARTEANPEVRTPYNAEVEKMIFEKYGHPKSLYKE